MRGLGGGIETPELGKQELVIIGASFAVPLRYSRRLLHNTTHGAASASETVALGGSDILSTAAATSAAMLPLGFSIVAAAK
jgi:hypothetical protein